MNANIDLSFPDIARKARIKLDSQIDTEYLSRTMERRGKSNNYLRDSRKIPNIARADSDYRSSHIDLSSLPGDFSRHTYMSRDNLLYYPDSTERTRNQTQLKANYASAIDM